MSATRNGESHSSNTVAAGSNTQNGVVTRDSRPRTASQQNRVTDDSDDIDNHGRSSSMAGSSSRPQTAV